MDDITRAIVGYVEGVTSEYVIVDATKEYLQQEGNTVEGFVSYASSLGLSKNVSNQIVLSATGEEE